MFLQQQIFRDLAFQRKMSTDFLASLRFSGPVTKIAQKLLPYRGENGIA
jgi:hypothetical protein